MASKSAKQGIFTPVIQFYKESENFLTKCQKPDKKEYMQSLKYCAIGFLVMGVIGYILKLVFIPINNIILGSN